MSLRGRLLVVVLGLSAIGLAVAGVVTYTALNSFLLARVDDQLDAAVEPMAKELKRGSSGERPSKLAVPDGTFAELRPDDGAAVERVFTFGQPGDDRPHLPVDLVGLDSGKRRTTVGGTGETDYRVLAVANAYGYGSLVIAAPLDDLSSTLRRLVVVEVLVAAAVLGAIAITARWVVGFGLRPLDDVEEATAAVASGDLSRRVARVDARTEVGRLGRSFNEMVDDIQTAFGERDASEQRLRRFVADAGHELRTPLAAIRGYAELFRRGAVEPPEDVDLVLARIEEHAERMSVLVDDLLLLARLDQGRPLDTETLDLTAIAADVVDDTRAIEPARQIVLDAPEPVAVVGDPDRLRQVAANLLANVRMHTPPRTRTTVRVASVNGHAVLEVSDDGPGMDPAAADRAFERFFRADPSRARESGGSGLGLAIVAAIVDAHGGTTTLSSAPSEGTTVRVALPRDGVRRDGVPAPDDFDQVSDGS